MQIARKIIPIILTNKYPLLLVKKEKAVLFVSDFKLIKLIKNIIEANDGKTIPLKYIIPLYFNGSK